MMAWIRFEKSSFSRLRPSRAVAPSQARVKGYEGLLFRGIGFTF